MSTSAFEHHWLGGLLGDEAIGAHFSVEAELQAMLRFEAALARAEAAEGLIPDEARDAIVRACESFRPDHAALQQATARDGLVVPEFVRQLRTQVGATYAPRVHFGTTSQDVIDTGLVLRLKPVIRNFDLRLTDLLVALDRLESRFGNRELAGVTRMQTAVPIKVSDRISAWRTPLAAHRIRLSELQPRLERLQFGGAAGTLDKLGDQGKAVARRMAESLELGLPARAWHSGRDGIVEFAGWSSLVTGSLGKLGQDLALMAQNSVREVKLSGGGGSSAMPHKQNPIGAETLVALARFNATLVGGMHQALVHENERSGAAWTLEWMILPQMTVAAGAALRTAAALCGSVTDMGAAG